MFAISVPLECSQVNLDPGEDQFAALIITSLEYFLHDVVSKWIFHHSLGFAVLELVRAHQ